MATVRDPMTFEQAVIFNGACTFSETPAEIVLSNLTGLAIGADGAGTAAPAVSLKKTAAGTADVNFLAADDLRGRIRLNASEAIVIETFDASEVSTGTFTMSNAAGAVALSGALAVTGATTMAAAACTTLAASGTATMAAINASGTVAAAGAMTVGTTLGVTGATTLAAASSTALSATTSLTVTGAAIVGLHEHVTLDIALLDGTAVYGFASPVAGTITKIQSRLKAALTTGDATLTGKIGATGITDGVITITQAASAAGDIDSVTPSAANVVVVGSNVNFTVGGTNDAAVGATITVTFLRSA